MVKVHPVSTLLMRRGCSPGWRFHAQSLSTVWSSTAYAGNLSLCDQACDWRLIEPYNALNDGVAPAADYPLFLLGITRNKMCTSSFDFPSLTPRSPVSSERTTAREQICT